MSLIAYYEGSDALREWLEKLVGEQLEFRKLPTANSSNAFTQLPAYVADILYLDKPDVIISGTIDGVHERPMFSIELATCTPQYQHALQRFSRMMASVVGGCPSAIVIPARKRENMESEGGSPRMYVRSQALDYGTVRLMDTFGIPALVFDWPDSDGILMMEGNDPFPPLNSPSIKHLRALLAGAKKAFRNIDYISGLWRLPDVRTLVERTRERAYRDGAPSLDKPGGGTGVAGTTQANLELVSTDDLLRDIRTNVPHSAALLKSAPDFLRKREKSVVFRPTRLMKHAGDPYVGMVGYYDIAFCRNGRSTRDRMYNLVAWCNGLSISDVQDAMRRTNQEQCPFVEDVNPKNILQYSYHLRHGCRETKAKPLRIYSELVDLLVFEDGVIFNVG